ncbi:dermonecrotic toxin domain-containing protein [Pseudomonas ceruminis]|uniref:dermonecrotic toxin domain-containing protein n=1 Tax=Pseudomonas ceruminis TaxID=2740516 RepID=UPI0015968277|nr:DUF6543 domain-containing protein [Pseudomonas ceruminis]
MPQSFDSSADTTPIGLDDLTSPLPLPTTPWITAGRGNALGQADLRRRKAVKALNSVFKQASLQPSPGHASFWDARMPGQSIARRAFAEKQLQAHFHSALDLNYGFERIAAKAWNLGQLGSDSQYAQLHWHQPGVPIGACPTALLITPTDDDEPWLLYRPDAHNPVRAFPSEAALLQWAHKHRNRLWRTPPAALASDSDSTFITVIARPGDGFAGLLNSMLAHAQPTDLGIQLHVELPDALSEELAQLVSADEALAQDEVHFDSLDERLPLGWRKQRIERQEQLLAAYLGDDAEPGSARLAELQTHQAKLDAQDSALQQLLAAVPETATAEAWGQADGDSSRFEHLSQHFAKALLLEAEFQHRLGDLSEPHLQWVRQLVEQPNLSLERQVVPCALKLVVGTRTWVLTGFITLRTMHPDTADDADTTVLLYKPGHDGGLACYPDQAQLFERLLNTLQGAWPEVLLESAWPQDIDALLTLIDSGEHTPALVSEPITSHVFDYLASTHLALLTQAEPASQLQLRWKLGASNNAARTQAFERLAERNRTANLHIRLHSLSHLTAPQRDALAAQFEALRASMQASSSLLARDLPERGQFSRNLMNSHLRQTLNLETVPRIKLDIADRTGKQRVPLPESGFPNAYKEVTTFSAERSLVPLEQFLLWALNDDLTLRLGNANIVIENAAATPGLQQTLNHSYIANLVQTLDAAGAYEQQIRDTFRGSAAQSDWQAQWRQEILRAPFEHQLNILLLSRPVTLDAHGMGVFEQFCREQQDTTLTRTIEHCALDLRPGVAADGSSDRVPLSGIFLLKPASGPCLLLLPDAPNGKVITQYEDSEQACLALADMAIDEAMRTYLASRPLEGDTSTHLSYINQALLIPFTGFIGVGTARSEPLAQVRADQLMGRLILEHRASSRSQIDLYLEREAIRHGRVYDYLKLALGFVPGVGAAIALYDGWSAANASVEAFLRGSPGEGVEHLNSVFLSLVDALFDVVPAAVVSRSSSALARKRTHLRQRLDGLRPTTVTRRGRPDPFSGYETEAPSGHWHDHPGVHGKGVYRHAETGNEFIVRHGLHYQVEWDTTYRTWRLKEGAARSYKQPVKLDELGTWQPHGSLSGRIIDGGLAGGGAYLGRLYQQGWQHLRGYLGRQPSLASPRQVVLEIDNGRRAHQAKLIEKISAWNTVRGVGPNGPQGTPASPGTIRRALHESAEQLEAFVTFHEQSLEKLRRIRPELGRHYQAMHNELAFNLGRQHPKLIRQLQLQMQDEFTLTMRLERALDATPTSPLKQLQEIRRVQEGLCQTLGKLEVEFQRVTRVTHLLRGSELTVYQQALQRLDMPMDPNGYRAVRLAIEAARIVRVLGQPSYDYLLMLRQVNQQISDLRSLLFSHHDLPSAGLSRAQEHRFLRQLKDGYQRFYNYMTSWQDDFPRYIDTQTTRRMHQALSTLIGEVEAQILASAPIKRAPTVKHGPSRPRLFETVDQQLLIGREVTLDGQPQMQVGNRLNQETHITFSRAADNLWQPRTAQPASPTAELTVLEASARTRLAEVTAQQAKLQQYKALNMTPASLEDLANGYATTLEELARDIARRGEAALTEAQRQLPGRLESAAAQMRRVGRQLRIDQVKATQRPEPGHLDYLQSQGEVRISWSRVLEPARNRKGEPIEYLEEYRIDDAATDSPLWYAHFHFKHRPAQGFARLEAGHIKLAHERNLGAGAWRGALTQSQANSLFGGLRPA